MNIATVYWKPIKDNPLIWYMLIDGDFRALIEPTSINAIDIKENLNSIFNEFDARSNKNGYSLKYKSVFKQYKRHREDSSNFHDEINNIINKREIKADRKQAKLSENARKTFKKALVMLNFQTKPNEIIDLWSICLKVGQNQSGVKKAIEKLWKNQKKIKRFDKDTKKLFNEFYRQLDE